MLEVMYSSRAEYAFELYEFLV